MLAPADITEITPGLWRWTARHPEWVAGAKAESAADWPPEVGSVAYAAPDALVLIDPLVPEDAGGLWSWLDERAADRRGRVAVLTTLKWHRRSREVVAERYGASTSRAREAAPQGIEPIPIRGAGETMFWIEAERTLVCGDRLMGDGRGGLRTCPESWLSYLGSGIGVAGLRDALRPLAKLEPVRVLVSHGEPVLRNGAKAIRRALD